MTQPILSRDQVLKIVRKTLKENGDRDKLSSARFVELAAAIEAAVLERVCGEPAAEVVREHFAGRVVWDFKVFDRAMKHGTKLYTLKDRQS